MIDLIAFDLVACAPRHEIDGRKVPRPGYRYILLGDIGRQPRRDDAQVLFKRYIDPLLFVLGVGRFERHVVHGAGQ